MASQEDHQSRDFPKVLLLKPMSTLIGEQPFTSTKFQYLKAYESPLALHQFLATHAQEIQAILSYDSAPVNAEILRQLPNVRVVVTTTAGVNHIDLPECCRRGIIVANSGDIYSSDVADVAVGLLISVLRKITAADRYMKQGLRAARGDYPLGSKLGGKRVGIVGLGHIGSLVAKRLEAFGCQISYNSRKKKPCVSYPFYAELRELAANSDALIVCCGLTEKTYHMIDKEVLAALGKDGVIVNIGRGPIIDEKEMVRRLVQGELGGAGLDVFENEPDVPKELFALDNVVMTPHNAVLTPESLKDVAKHAVGNLEAFFANRPLLSPYMDE
ncbi:glyoxylate/hydroxypyruvate reductase HPR3-like [Tripterygium wilfordii]|uniref:glyoxylate reductase (NADP(+)) n=1 Tax=Tripterygium wilfordii TaxID=458696 RepID=A0A7J7CFM1_TRIWF|nr:glyoxylate/hydroxypyruvate reductase HPR3-like [Tripterygium wilfordii]KAF5732984.1 glyoxylate/hydroxypyruvate reductase HPR3-like [Tripterygium wilfordii]